MEIKATEIKIVQTEKLVPHPRNRNKHPEKQIVALSKIIKARGFRRPITVSNLSGFITSGHGRWEAAKLLNAKNVPVMYQNYENEAEEVADLNADNNIQKYAEFDQAGFIDDLQELNIDLGDVDFEEFGLLDFDFSFPDQDTEDEDEDESSQREKKYLLEVQLGNELELRDLYDDLVSKGYMVKEK